MKKVEGKWGIAITKSHFQDHRAELFGEQGNGNNSLEADEAINERGIIRYATLDEYKANPGFANEGEGHEKTDQEQLAVSQLGVQRATPGACRST